MTEDDLDSLAIFPLSNAVLFPAVRVPLHVFEPRYRQMVADALEGDRRIGMTTVRCEHVAEMSGDPPLFPVGCAGEIERADRLPDGRYNIVLLGTHRFRVIEEPKGPSDRLYRVATVETLEEDEQPALDPARRDQLVDLVVELVRRVDNARADELARERLADVDSRTFVNSLACSIDLPPREKQVLLEANGVSQRCDHMIEMLRFRLAEHAAARSADDDLLH